MVDSAFTVGDTPVRIIANIYKDKVCDDVPEQKNEMRKSSNEIIKTSNPAAINAGLSKGITIQ